MRHWHHFVVMSCVLALGLIALSGTAAAAGCSYPVTETDATDTAITVSEEPDRVVTLAPSAAQTMWEIGARGKVVGVSEHAAYLEGADNRTSISGGDQMVSIETVVNLTPDLVLAPNVVGNETVEALRRANLTVYYFPEATSIDDVSTKTHLIGRLAGACEGSNATVDWMGERLDTVREATADRERPSTLYLFFGYTAGSETFIDDIITTAGGENAAARANITGYKPVNEEIIVSQDPEWLVRNDENPLGVDGSVLNQTQARQRNQTVTLSIEYVNQPAPRVVYAVTTLAEAFHSDAFAETNESTTTADETDSSSTGSDSASDGSPGFTAVAALVAVVGLVVARFQLRE